MSLHPPRIVVSITALLMAAVGAALASGCRNEIWLSEPDGRAELDAGADAGRDASLGPRDANDVDAVAIDAPTIAEDAALPARACERAPVPVVSTLATGPLEAPSLATSGRDATLRFGVLVPPAASATPTSDTRLLVLDDEGTVLADRAFRVDDASGSASSGATLHSLPEGSGGEGFLLLAPTSITWLDGDGVADPSPVMLATAPSPTWQRAAGWLDADRFAFVSDTPDLRVAVVDRTSGMVTATPIAVAGAAAVHIEPGGITVALDAPSSDVIVYDPDLSGAEALRVTWADGSALGSRLLGAGLAGTERTWLIHDTCEFRTIIRSFLVAPSGASTPGSTLQLRCPLVATREGPFLAIASENQFLAVYDFGARTFSTLARTFEEPPLVESERDGAHVAVLFRETTAASATALDLACGLR
ncbi:MAG: hypothetical protein U0234_23130 [Sandaracinus sp.]